MKPKKPPLPAGYYDHATYERETARARTIRERGESPKAHLRYLREQAENPDVAPADRVQFGRLADELGARIDAPAVVTEPLFDVPAAGG